MEQQKTAPAKSRLAPVLTGIFLAAAVGLGGGAGLHYGGGVALIDGGHTQAGLKAIDIFGASAAPLDAELYAQVCAGDAPLVKALLDRGAKFDWGAGSAAIVKGRPDILGLLLDRDSSQAESYLIGGIVNKEGTQAILEVAHAHGAKVGYEALTTAAQGRPDLLPWVIAHGTFEKADVMEAQVDAIANGHTESFARLRALAEPDAATKEKLAAAAARKPGVLDWLRKNGMLGDGVQGKTPAPRTFAPVPR